MLSQRLSYFIDNLSQVN